MMELYVVGKTAFPYLAEGVGIYEKRLKRYTNFSTVVIPDVKNARNMDERQIKRREGEAVLKKLDKSAYLVLLDDKGKAFSSMGFAEHLERKLLPMGRKVVFAVGGAYGFSEEVYARADARMSLSRMTFSHQMVRLFFVEQLYRAFSILNNEPYHHE